MYEFINLIYNVHRNLYICKYLFIYKFYDINLLYIKFML